MLVFPEIDPVAVELGPVKIHWYGLMYLAAFAMGWWLGRLRAPRHGWTGRQMDDLVFYFALGAVIGGRLGYVVFYDLEQFIAAPSSLLKVWQGGMSFHGGLVGVLVAMWLFARAQGFGFFQVADFVAPLVPPGLGAGRLGNFINGELWGRPTELPWGMLFPDPRAGGVARHPSQVYQLLLEGVVLFAILWIFTRKPRPPMAASGLFLLAYGAFRFGVEFVRNPDSHIGYLALGWVTMGQVLSVPMILLGAGLLWWSYRDRGPTAAVGAARGS